MKARPANGLRLGSNVVEFLLPQRRPFLMVDRVEAFAETPVPALSACRHISANESVFDGHFSGLHLWPGAFTTEGLGQTTVILMVILQLRRTARERNEDPELVLDALRNVDRGFRLHPGYRAADAEAAVEVLKACRTRIAVGASTNIKFLKPVFAGCRLDYAVMLTDEVGNSIRVEAEATVDGEPVTSGVMTGTFVQPPQIPGA